MRKAAWFACGAFALTVLGSTGCGDSAPDDNTNDSTNDNLQCAAGYQAEGPACVPIFDSPADCPGPNEMPAAGGGCLAVGVTACATGFETDGAGGCEAILPAAACGPGTKAQLGSDQCHLVGVPLCAAGFTGDGGGGCEAILPAAPCADGTIAALGQTTCQPLGSCGSGTWGALTDDGDTVFVDGAADPAGADGTMAHPWVTIAEGLAAAAAGQRVAIAAGTYAENLVLDRPVELAGRCAEQVLLQGTGDAPTVRITTGANGPGTVLRDLTITGDGTGIQLDSARGVTGEQLQVLDTGAMGIVLLAGAEATIRTSVVARTTQRGLLSDASDLTLQDSVVRDTLPAPGGTHGRGLQAWCSQTNGCGSLSVTGCLFDSNREVGILALGTDTTIARTVVRNTDSTQTGALWGMGINAACDEEVNVCPALTVSDCLVAGNRHGGIAIIGADAVVETTTVRDTRSQLFDLTAGVGVNVQCDMDVDACGSFLLRDSRVTGNRHTGVTIAGVDTEIHRSIISDTLPEESTNTMGRGMSVQCHPFLGHCGTLDVVDTLIVDNLDTGVVTFGTVATIRSTVIQGTGAEPVDDTAGFGILARCDPDAERCGSMTVQSSWIDHNQTMGVASAGVDLTVAASLVTGTQSQVSDQLFGWGVVAFCSDMFQICGTLSVTSSVVAGNREVGIIATGVEATIDNTVVRDQLPVGRDDTKGDGIAAQCKTDMGVCGSLTVTNSLVHGNRDVGLLIFGPPVTVTSSVISATLPQTNGIDYGRGVSAQCDTELGACGLLTLDHSLLIDNHNAGLFLFGVPAALTGTVIADTVPDPTGRWGGDYGQGIWAMCDDALWACPTLTMTESLIEASYTAGVASWGASGTISDSVIRGVLPRPLDDTFGYGLQVEGFPGAPDANLDIANSQIANATVAGVFYYHATGIITDSAVSGADFSVAWSTADSAPTDGGGNLLNGNFVDGISRQELEPSPAPAPAVSNEPTDEPH